MPMINLSTGIPALFEPAQGSHRRGGLVVAQEIFGLNRNIRSLCTRFAGDGFDVIAPAYFDRIEAGFTAPYDQDGIQKGLSAVRATLWDQVTVDTQAAIDVLAETHAHFCDRLLLGRHCRMGRRLSLCGRDGSVGLLRPNDQYVSGRSTQSAN